MHLLGVATLYRSYISLISVLGDNPLAAQSEGPLTQVSLKRLDACVVNPKASAGNDHCPVDRQLECFPPLHALAGFVLFSDVRVAADGRHHRH
jgi:hypothetical protein